MAVIGLDAGTTGIKAVMYEADGSLLGTVSKQYNMHNPGPGHFELSPGDIHDAAINALKELLAKTGIRQIDAVGATSFGESTVLLDEHDEPVCNILLYMDERGTDECIEFKKICDARSSFIITGEVPHPMLSMYKLKYLKRNGYLQRVKKIFFIADYILYVLGGEHCTDFSLAARSGMFDVTKNEWWQEGLNYLGIGKSCLPAVVPSGTNTGNLSPGLREKLGITGGVVLVIAGHDQNIASVGAGVFNAGQVMNGLGSVDNMTVTFSKNHVPLDFFALNFCIMPYALEGVFSTYLYNFSGGNLIRWFKNEFMKDITEQAYSRGKKPYLLMDKMLPRDPANILVTPHFSGTGTPDLNTKAKGIISGLTFRTTREELYRAVLEGEAFDMKMNLDCLESIGVTPASIITVGGGSGSDAWMQIRSDVFDKEIRVYDNPEAGAQGTAILAMINIGLFRTGEDAHASMTHGWKAYYPNPKHVKIYNEKFFEYKKLYKLSNGLYH
jgi:xylulokinase